MNNRIFISLLLSVLIFCNALEEGYSDDIYSENRRIAEIIELDGENDAESQRMILSKKTVKKITDEEFKKYVDLENRSLINAKESVQIQSVKSCKKDKIAELDVVGAYDSISNMRIKYESGISGFFGEFDGGSIAQQLYVPRGLASAEVGDEVELCLLNKDYCPVGDERGYFYEATNLRTKEKWILRNSIRNCGEGFVRVKPINCKAAISEDEKIICQNPKLKFLDERMSAEYQNLLSVKRMAHQSLEKVKAEQVFWVKSRKLCKTSKCIDDSYKTRLEFLDQFLVKSDNLIIGTCSKDKIKNMANNRLGNKDFVDDGFSILYSSGHVGIGYNHVPQGILGSKIGDDIILCYDSGPGDCPIRDDRGSGFTAYNLRTNKSWSLSNSKRSCGGA